MALIRRSDAWDPFRDLVGIQDEVNKLFNQSLAAGGRNALAETGEWLPGVDIVEEKDRIVVSTDLPGLKQEEIAVEVADDILTIRGERKRETERKDGTVHRTERVYGTFLRSFSLPQTVDGARVGAEYKNGVLTVTLPKREEVRPRQIKVDVK
jgi:HSP20 family protein